MIDKDLVEVTCNMCKSKFKITYGVARKRKEKPFYCKLCRSKRKSEMQKQRWKNMSEDERKTLGKSIQNGINNMSNEAKIQRSIHSSISTKAFMDSLSDEDKMERSKKLSLANKMRYQNMSEDERKRLGLKISEGQRNIPEDIKRIINKKRSESLKKYIQNLSPEERARRNQLVQDWWDNMEIDYFQNWNKNRALGYTNYIESLSYIPNHNEKTFIELISKLGLINFEFQYYNRFKHPEFDKIFPYNPVTGSKYISPYHKWDFIIHTLMSNILIDIDGSIHFNKSYNATNSSTNITYQMLDYHKFNDSQRPYQTDGLDAYIVQTPDDDILNEKCTVLSLKENKIISLNEMIYNIIFDNCNNEKRNKLFKIIESNDGNIPVFTSIMKQNDTN